MSLPYTDYLLRTDTAGQMETALVAADLMDADGHLMPGVNLDPIGEIPAILDPEGEVIRPGDNRYHANLRVTVDLTAAQIALLPTFAPAPTVPYRVWA